MGNRLLPHHYRQAQRGRALRLSQGRVGTHVQRTSNEPPRRSAALELAAENPEVVIRVPSSVREVVSGI